MSETRRRVRPFYLAAASLLAVVIAADTALWAVACGRLDTGLRDTAAKAGWALSADASGWGGWPAAAEVTLQDAVLHAGPEIVPPLTWTAARATFRLSVWHPTVLTGSAAGAQTLGIGGSAPVPFKAQSLAAIIDLAAHDPIRIAADVLDIAAPGGPVRVAAASLTVVPDEVSADLSGLVLPGRAGQPITPPIDTLHLTGQLTPAVEPQPTASESARRWRAHDGRVDLNSISLRWGPLDATGRATLTLDQALQPAIAGQVTATGLVAVIEQLVQTGAMTRPAATAAQGMLAILSAPTGGGPLTLPVTLRDGIVSVARIPLLRVAPLVWN